MVQRKGGLSRQVTSYKRSNSYEIVYGRTRKRWPLNKGDCLIEVTAQADFTVYRMETSRIYWAENYNQLPISFFKVSMEIIWVWDNCIIFYLKKTVTYVVLAILDFWSTQQTSYVKIQSNVYWEVIFGTKKKWFIR